MIFSRCYGGRKNHTQLCADLGDQVNGSLARGGVDLNHRSLGYEPRAVGNFNNLQHAGGSQKPCKERLEIFIGQQLVRNVWKSLLDSKRTGALQSLVRSGSDGDCGRKQLIKSRLGLDGGFQSKLTFKSTTCH